MGVPLRNGVPDPYREIIAVILTLSELNDADRMQPKNQPEINDTVLRLAGVKAY